MPNEVVKYNNDLNKLEFKGFEQEDFDLLMAICARMRDLDEEVQIFEYSYLMDLVNWDKTQRVKLFDDALKRMNNKLATIKADIILKDGREATLVLFPTFIRDSKNRTLEVSVNPRFKFILNDLTANFTRFELKEYVDLEGRYAKQLYTQIKQRYRLKGSFMEVSVDELRQMLSIPESYSVKEITRSIVVPAATLIKSCKGLHELEITIIKAARRGCPVKGYRFTWTAPKQIPGQLHIDDALAPDNPKTTKRKPKKNKFNEYDQRQYTASDYDDLEERKIGKL